MKKHWLIGIFAVVLIVGTAILTNLQFGQAALPTSASSAGNNWLKVFSGTVTSTIISSNWHKLDIDKSVSLKQFDDFVRQGRSFKVVKHILSEGVNALFSYECSVTVVGQEGPAGFECSAPETSFYLQQVVRLHFGDPVNPAEDADFTEKAVLSYIPLSDTDGVPSEIALFVKK